MYNMTIDGGMIDATFTLLTVIGLMMLSLGSVLLYDPPAGTVRDVFFEETQPAAQVIPAETTRKHKAA